MKRLILSLLALAGFGLFALPTLANGPRPFDGARIVPSGPFGHPVARVVCPPAGPDVVLPGGAPALGEPEGDARSRYSVVFPGGHQMTVIGGGYVTPPACRPVAGVVCPAPTAVCAPVAPCAPERVCSLPVPRCVEVEWGGTWWPAEVLRVQGGQSYIHYTGWADSWNEWVTPDRVRLPGRRN
jgi:hypothetical protein